jgi:hypothetical protein
VVVSDAATRRTVLEHAAARWYRSQVDLERLVAEAPMVEVIVDAPPDAAAPQR